MASLSTSAGLLCLVLSLHLLLSLAAATEALQSQHRQLRRQLQALEEDEEDTELPLPPLPKKKSTSSVTGTPAAAAGKNLTKSLKPKKANSTAVDAPTGVAAAKIPKPSNSTKLPKPFNSTKLLKPSNSTKLLKPTNSTKLLKPTKAANSTAATKTLKAPKTLNATAAGVGGGKPSKKLSDLPPPKADKSQSGKPIASNSKPKQQQGSKSKGKAEPLVPWFDSADDPSEEETDLIAEFRDLPAKFQQHLLPDLERISTTSKVYITRANREITRGMKPLVGNRYAPAVASLTSALFLVLPLLLVAALLHQVRTYLSLPRILLFVHAYLAIYFSVLSLTAAITGLEPLRLFYATSPGPYVYTQVLQTLGYVLFLLLQIMYLVVVFATAAAPASPEGAAARALALGQLVVGLAVGLHYYTAVFHRAVVGEPPRTNWRVHGLYAACFVAICAFARAAERRKKAYLLGGPGSDEGKKS